MNVIKYEENLNRFHMALLRLNVFSFDQLEMVLFFFLLKTTKNNWNSFSSSSSLSKTHNGWESVRFYVTFSTVIWTFNTIPCKFTSINIKVSPQFLWVLEFPTIFFRQTIKHKIKCNGWTFYIFGTKFFFSFLF